MELINTSTHRLYKKNVQKHTWGTQIWTQRKWVPNSKISKMADNKALILTLVKVAARSAHLASPRPDWRATPVRLKRLRCHARTRPPPLVASSSWRHKRLPNEGGLKFSRRYVRQMGRWLKIGPMDRWAGR